MSINKNIIISAVFFFMSLGVVSCGGKSTEIYLAPTVQSAEELTKLHAREKEVLTTYKLLDAENGIYRIPIDSAFSKLINVKSYK